MDETRTPRPNPYHPVWGPPRNPPVAEQPGARRLPHPSTTRRRHPAAGARRITGWAAVASSAALVGYMVTANAQTNGSSTATPTVQPASPTAPTTPSTAPASTEHDDVTPATVPATTPAPSTPVQLPIPSRTQPNAQLPPLNGGGRPNTSTHGS